MNITAKDIRFVDSIRLKILDSFTKEEIEELFLSNEIDYPQRIAFLWIAMQIQEVYGYPSESTTPDREIYEYYLKFYLEGEWKQFV